MGEELPNEAKVRLLLTIYETETFNKYTSRRELNPRKIDSNHYGKRMNTLVAQNLMSVDCKYSGIFVEKTVRLQNIWL